MRRTIGTAMTIGIIAATLTACGSSGGGSSDKPAGTPGSTTGGPKPAGATSPKDAAAAWAIIHAAVPTSKYTLTVTQANDGNHLLGRPHQYTSAMKFADTRIKASDTSGLEKGDVGYGGGIEAFANHSDAQARADYIQAIVKASPMFAEYDYVAGNFVIRVSNYLTPTQAAEYKNAAAKLG